MRAWCPLILSRFDLFLTLQALCLACFGFSRLAVFLGHRSRFKGSSSLEIGQAFLIGTRMDLTAVALFFVPVVPILFFIPDTIFDTLWYSRFLMAVVGTFAFVLILGAIVEFFYFAEYGAKFNQIFLEYARPSREVMGMLWKDYPLVIVAIVVSALSLVAALGLDPLIDWFAVDDSHWPSLLLEASLATAWLFYSLRGVKRRPIGVGAWEFSNSQSLNQLAANGFYQAFRIWYDERKHGGSVAKLFGKSGAIYAESIVTTRVEGPGVSFVSGSPNPLDRIVKSSEPARNPNVVFVLMESHAAAHIGTLGAKHGVTPHFDRIAREGLLATRMYASGDRTARGLEAVLSSFPPLPGMSTLKRAGAHGSLFTSAKLFQARGYDTKFYYGGDAAYDNMRGFMLSNGFDAVFEQKDVVNPIFETSWGISDESIYDKILEDMASQPLDRPAFRFMLTISNHRPYIWPSGKFDPIYPRDKVATTFQYADFAMGRFIDAARNSPAWKNTIFVFVADHGNAVHGRSLVPIERFHIPMLILAPGIEGFTPGRIDTPCSQIDVLPTLLGLLGGEVRHCCFGRDLRTLDPGQGSALMHYYGSYAFMKGDLALMLSPSKKPKLFTFNHALPGGRVGEELRDSSPTLEAEALALLRVGEQVYRRGTFVCSESSPRTGEPGPQRDDSGHPQGNQFIS